MKIARALALVALVALSGPGQAATVRELDAAELRQAARSGDLISLKRAIEAVAKSTGGEPIEARAFEIEELYYRIVLKKPNGAVISVILNARTGEQVPKGSAATCRQGQGRRQWQFQRQLGRQRRWQRRRRRQRWRRWEWRRKRWWQELKLALIVAKSAANRRQSCESS
jgi:hypothetical protein